METVRSDLMLTLPLDKNSGDTLLTTGLLSSSQILYSRLTPKLWKKIFSFLVPEHLRIPQYTRGWMGKEWEQLVDFLKLRAVFRYAQDELYQTLCAECTFSVADSVRKKNTMTVVPAIERAAKFFGNIGLKHFRHVKSIQFIITGNKTGIIKRSEANRMLDALETLLQHCSPSMKLKDAQLRCHELPVQYYYLDTGTKITISGYVLDGPKPDMSFIGPRTKNLKAFGRGHVPSERLNTTLMHRYESGRPVNFMKALPPELRLEIYGMLIVHAPTEYAIKGGGPIWKGDGYDFTAFLAVNAEMRQEFSKLLYSKCQFSFDAQLFFTSLSFVDKIGSANAANICDVVITFEISFDDPVCTIKDLLSKIPNYGILHLDASKFGLYSTAIERKPWSFPGRSRLRRVLVFRVPEIGRNKLEFRVITSWLWLPMVFRWESGRMKPDVLLQALQASIDGKEFFINSQGLLTTWWPAGTPTPEKCPKVKKIRW
ncbi:hypothetical protein MMC17_008748 [Xylographa soralifera]|nr:hypothetical protein [Xylographa soralifera]